MAYALAGGVIGAILIRVLVLLRRRYVRAAEGERMSARLESVTG